MRSSPGDSCDVERVIEPHPLALAADVTDGRGGLGSAGAAVSEEPTAARGSHSPARERAHVGSAALRVGYENAAQFNREYGRFFSRSPGRDIRALKSG